MDVGASRLRRVIIAILMAPILVPAVRGEVVDTVQLVRKANGAMKAGEYERAEQLFKEALASAPDSVDAARGLGWVCIKLRKYAEADAVAADLLRKTPDDAYALGLSGFALMRSGLLREAADVFLRAVTASATEPIGVAGLAEILFFTGNFEESLRFAEQAVRLTRDEPDFLLLLGQVAARQERFEEAADVYALYLRTAPKLDRERRDRIKAIIDFCRALVGTKLYVKRGEASAVLPLEFSAAYLPIVTVTIDRKGPFRFAIDTGSGFVVISDETAAKLKIRPIARGGTSQGVGGEGRFPLVYGLIKSFGLGKLELTNVPTYIRKSHQGAADPIDGYIGLSILARYLSTIDYGNRRLELMPQQSPPAEIAPGDVAISYQVTAGGMLSVPTDISTGGLLNFVVDTGASTSVVSTEVFKRYDLGARLGAGQTARVVGAAGVTEGVPTVVFESLSIPAPLPDRPLRHDSVRALVLDLGAVNETSGYQIAGIIGGNVLRNYRLVLDTLHGRLILRSNSPQRARR